MKKILVFGTLLSLSTAVCHAQTPSRIAVFDPQTSTAATHMDVAEMNAVAQTLENAGLGVSRVTTAQIDDVDAFSAQKFDVLVLRGDEVARENFPEIEKFAGDGGVVVALASRTPLNHAVERKAGGEWAFLPASPQFSWQTDDLSDAFGFRYIYRPVMIDSGVRHTAMPLFKKYLPQATDMNGMLPATWIVPASGGTFYPLVRSRRGDGQDVSPQIYIARKAGRTAVIAASEFWTKGSANWSFGAQTTVALVKIALDLRSGALKVSEADKIDLPADAPAPEPLTTRVPIGEVNPDNAPVVSRWGKFDGSGLELGEKTPLPRVLKAGTSIQLPLRFGGQPQWLRVRGAVAESGAVLKVVAGQETLWNESLAYLDVGKVGNFGNADLGGVPLEFNRRIFVPPSAAKVFTLSNSGQKPLYFDAIQLENAPPKPVTWMTGMGAAWNQLVMQGPVNLPRERTREWTGIRGTIWAYDVKAPGEPDRFATIDKRLQSYLSTGAPLEILIESTPGWAAINPERYAATKNKRSTPPDPEKYRQIVDYVLQNYADKTDLYEIWNEVDSKYYWSGNAREYIDLWKAIVPLIREKDPTARVMISGFTGFTPQFLDECVAAGLTKEADLMGFHPYAGNQAAWDKPFTNIQGQLYSLGQNIEIYNNEMGFPNSFMDWFTAAPFPYTPTTQERMTEVALSRLLANGSTKFNLFLSGGADGGMSYINGKGEPYPAYKVVQDYFPLSKNGGNRLDVSMARTDGASQRGIYLAGARHNDGSLTLVVNPAEFAAPDFAAPADAPKPKLDIPLLLRVPLDETGARKAVFGGQSVPIKVVKKGGAVWGEIKVRLKARTVLTVSAVGKRGHSANKFATKP